MKCSGFIGLMMWVLATSACAATPSQFEAQLDKQRMTAHVRLLAQSIGDRREGTDKERRAAHYIAGQFGRRGYHVRFEKFRLPDGSLSQNVIAEKWVKSGQKYFILGAHYDSRQGSPGANDNASGVAVLLELARVLANNPRSPVRFIAFGAEDRWEARYRANAHRLNGSRYHVARLSTAARQRIQGMISLDMVGVGNVLQIGALRGSRTSDSRRLAETLLQQAQVLKVPNQRFRTRPWSDHVWFDRAGMPAVWMWWYPDRHFDTPRDVVTRVSPDKMHATARVALRGMLTWRNE